MAKMRVFLKEWREKSGLTQSQLAERLDLAAAAISRIELGHSNPSISDVERFADALGIEPIELFKQPQ